MALSLVELLKGTSDPVASGVIENIITVDEVVANLPFISVGSRDSMTFLREKALPATSQIASGATITPTTTLTYDRVQQFIRRIVCDQDLDILDSGAAGGITNARMAAISKASKAVGRTYAHDVAIGDHGLTVTANSFGGTGWTAATIVAGPGHDVRQPIGVLRWVHAGTTICYKAPGDTTFGAVQTYSAGARVYSDNPDKWVTVNFTAGGTAANGDITFTLSVGTYQVEGMSRLVATSQTILPAGVNGDAISLTALDQLADRVTDTQGTKVYIMNRRTRRSVAALLRLAGGASMSEFRAVQVPAVGATYPTYNGIPILCSDWISIAETYGGSTTTGSVYCATIGEDAGLCGMYSEASQDAEDAGELISRSGNGLTVLNLGTVQSADTKRIRVKAYWGLLNKSELGLAALTGITN